MAVIEIIAKNIDSGVVNITELDTPNGQIGLGLSYTLSNTNKVLDIIANEELYSLIDADKIELTVSSIVLTKDQALAFLRLEFLVDFDFANAIFSGTICMDGEISPPTISSDQNNYAPTGISTANSLRLSSNATRTISGIVAPSPLCNQVLYIVNVGTNNIQLRNNSNGSSAENRFLIGGNKTLQSDEGITIVYDKTSQRWRAYGINN